MHCLPLIFQALHDTFAAFGNVLSCKVATDEHGASRGYGFVHYETAEAADNAIRSVNGMLLNDKKVFVGHHISRKVRCVSSLYSRRPTLLIVMSSCRSVNPRLMR